MSINQKRAREQQEGDESAQKKQCFRDEDCKEDTKKEVHEEGPCNTSDIFTKFCKEDTTKKEVHKEGPCNASDIFTKFCIECFITRYVNCNFAIMNFKEEIPKYLHSLCRNKSTNALLLLQKICELKDSPEKAVLINLASEDNKTPLQVCIEVQNIAAVDIILKQPLVDIFKVPSKGGVSPFQAAIENILMWHMTAKLNQNLSQFLDSDEENCFLVNSPLETEKQLTSNFTSEDKKVFEPLKLLLFKLNSIMKSVSKSEDFKNVESTTYKYCANFVKIFSQMMVKCIDNQVYYALYLMMSTGISYEKISQFPDFQLPIFTAAHKGDMKIIKMMIHSNTNFTVKKRLDQLPIHILAAKGFLNSLNLILNTYYLNQPADDILDQIFHPTEDTKMTVLHFSALNNHPNTLSYLLSIPGAHNYINRRNKNGSTPLLCASSKGNLKCLQILLRNPLINLFIGDLHGNTPIVYATYYKRDDCAIAILGSISEKLKTLSGNNNTTNTTTDDENKEEKSGNGYEEKSKIIESLLVEKRKWFILSNIDSTKQNPVVELDSLAEGNSINSINKNLESIEKSFDPNADRLPTLEIKINKFERGSGVLRNWLRECASQYASHFLKSNIFNYSNMDDETRLLHCSFDSDNNKTGYECFINLKDYPLYIPYYHKVTHEDIRTMTNFGLFIAIAFLYNPIYLPMSPIFFKYLLAEEITVNDFLPSYYLKIIRELNDCDDDSIFEMYDLDMCIRSVTSSGEYEDIELIPGGKNIPITKTNFHQFQSRLRSFFLIDGGRAELLKSFKTGFFKFLDEEKFRKYLTSAEIIRLTLKKPDYIPLAEWRRYTKVKLESTHSANTDATQPPNEVEWFFDFVTTLNSEQQSRLIEFACGSPVLPLGNLSTLSDDNHPFTLQYEPNSVDRLPWAFTCNYTLHLPTYSCKELLFQKFNLALEHFKGFQFV